MKKLFCIIVFIQCSLFLFSQRKEQQIENNNTVLSFVKDVKLDHFYFTIKDKSGEEKVLWHENTIDKVLAVEGMGVDSSKCAMLLFTWTGCKYLLFRKDTEGVWQIKIFALIRPFENGLPPFKYAGEKWIDMETVELTYTDGKVVTFLVRGDTLIEKE